MKATISASFAGTSRFVQADETFGRIQTWAKAESATLLQSSALFEDVRHAIGSVKLVQTPELQLFRGRGPPFSGERPTREEMGPPPQNGHAVSGRYNRPGESVLYLSSMPDGVRRELSSTMGPHWIQSFVNSLSSLWSFALRTSVRPKCRHDTCSTAYFGLPS